ncbi:MAG: alginate lyase family protein [Planctomycetota bacterium]
MNNRLKAVVIMLSTALLTLPCAAESADQQGRLQALLAELEQRERERVLPWAERLLMEPPVTVTASQCERSAGGRHDFYSEGDYWWPNPDEPDGPYIRRDGKSNPDAFFDHRQYMMRLSLHVPALAAAYVLSEDDRYAEHAAKHLHAWFVDEETKMAPHLLYAQAIKGKTKGRGIGIIDTIHLVEVARAIEVLIEQDALDKELIEGVRAWFSSYLDWMTTHPNGKKEANTKNNHTTCYTMQVLAFASLAQEDKWIDWCNKRFTGQHISEQMAKDGSFPLELARTKPYGYSLFVLDAKATCAELLQRAGTDAWGYATEDGRGMVKGLDYLVPFIADKSSWPRDPDVMYDEYWPMRHPLLIFGAIRLNRPELLELYLKLPAESGVFEVNRNFFVRQPLLWLPRR